MWPFFEKPKLTELVASELGAFPVFTMGSESDFLPFSLVYLEVDSNKKSEVNYGRGKFVLTTLNMRRNEPRLGETITVTRTSKAGAPLGLSVQRTEDAQTGTSWTIRHISHNGLFFESGLKAGMKVQQVNNINIEDVPAGAREVVQWVEAEGEGDVTIVANKVVLEKTHKAYRKLVTDESRVAGVNMKWWQVRFNLGAETERFEQIRISNLEILDVVSPKWSDIDYSFQQNINQSDLERFTKKDRMLIGVVIRQYKGRLISKSEYERSVGATGGVDRRNSPGSTDGDQDEPGDNAAARPRVNIGYDHYARNRRDATGTLAIHMLYYTVKKSDGTWQSSKGIPLFLLPSRKVWKNALVWLDDEQTFLALPKEIQGAVVFVDLTKFETVMNFPSIAWPDDGTDVTLTEEETLPLPRIENAHDIDGDSRTHAWSVARNILFSRFTFCGLALVFCLCCAKMVSGSDIRSAEVTEAGLAVVGATVTWEMDPFAQIAIRLRRQGLLVVLRAFLPFEVAPDVCRVIPQQVYGGLVVTVVIGTALLRLFFPRKNMDTGGAKGRGAPRKRGATGLLPAVLDEIVSLTERNYYGIAVLPCSIEAMENKDFDKWVFLETKESNKAFDGLAKKIRVIVKENVEAKRRKIPSTIEIIDTWPAADRVGKLGDEIDRAMTAKQLSDLWATSDIQRMIEVVAEAQKGNDPVRFASMWARAKNMNEPWADRIEVARKCLLKLLKRLFDIARGDTGTGVFTKAELGPFRRAILDEFKWDVIEKILVHCLPLDRANALYCMKAHRDKDGPSPSNKLDWYATDLQESLFGNRDVTPNSRGGTINRRYLWIFIVSTLILESDGRAIRGEDNWRFLARLFLPVAWKDREDGLPHASKLELELLLHPHGFGVSSDKARVEQNKPLQDDRVPHPGEVWLPRASPYVFLSHSGKDNTDILFARPTLWLLREAFGIEAFLDDGRAALETETTLKLMEPAYECTLAVVILSPSFQRCPYCMMELNTFMRRRETDPAFQLVVVPWQITNVYGYSSSVDDIISWRQSHESDAVEFLTVTLWPRLMKALKIEEQSMRYRDRGQLVDDLVEYVLQQRGQTLIPVELEAHVSRRLRSSPNDEKAIVSGTNRYTYQVFLSHTYQDGRAGTTFAFHLVEHLRRLGITVFHDRDSIHLGDEWWNAIEEGVETCTVFVCILSSGYLFRHYCMKELDLAFKSHRRILPIFLDNAPSGRDVVFERLFYEAHTTPGRQQYVDQQLASNWLKNLYHVYQIQGIFANHAMRSGYEHTKLKFEVGAGVQGLLDEANQAPIQRLPKPSSQKK